jgi:uncharacterized membrane protein YedE/YeeE
VSGQLGGLLRWPLRFTSFGFNFVLGLVLGGFALAALFGAHGSSLAPRPLGLIAIAGVLVGFGTRLGNGCTSGHGVCGISRLSPRSFVATGVFMAAAALVVFVTRHTLSSGGSP